MFSLGLEFSLRKLRQVGATAFIAALLEIATLLAVGYAIGRAFGWSLMDSLFLGAIISISSTTIIIKALAELGKMKEGFAQLIFGILIVEDLLGILLIALLSGIAMTGTLAPLEVLEAAGRLAVFLVVALVLGLLARPAAAALRRRLQQRRDAARHRAGALLRRVAPRGEARLQRRAGRVHRSAP